MVSQIVRSTRSVRTAYRSPVVSTSSSGNYLSSVPPFVPAGAYAYLDFVNNQAWINGLGVSTASSLFTTTRAGSTYGTYTNKIALFGSGLPILTDLGLSINSAKTNLALRSNELNDVAWTVINGYPLVQGATAPDLTSNAFTWTGGFYIFPSTPITVSAGQPVTMSIYIKKVLSSWVQLFIGDGTFSINTRCWINLDTGDLGIFTVDPGITPIAARAESIGNGWYRCIFSATVAGTSINPGMLCCDTNGGFEGNGTYQVFGFNVVQGGAPGPYIPTAGSTASCVQDVINLSANVVGALGSGSWTTVITTRRIGIGGGVSEILSDGSTNIMSRNATAGLATAWGGAQATFSMDSSDWYPDKVNAISSDGSHVTLACTGIEAIQASNSSSVPSSLRLGSLSTTGMDGIVKDLAIYRSFASAP